MSFQRLWIIFIPLIFGAIAFYLFTRWKAKDRKISIVDGLCAWTLFTLFSFIGELFAHIIYPPAYLGVGDNPGQVAGLLTALIASIFLCPLIWISFRRGHL